MPTGVRSISRRQTDEREEATRQIAILNAGIDIRQTQMNDEWKKTPECAQLRERELREGRREMRAAVTCWHRTWKAAERSRSIS